MFEQAHSTSSLDKYFKKKMTLVQTIVSKRLIKYYKGKFLGFNFLGNENPNFYIPIAIHMEKMT
jgi:hypothetical protein